MIEWILPSCALIERDANTKNKTKRKILFMASKRLFCFHKNKQKQKKNQDPMAYDIALSQDCGISEPQAPRFYS